MVWLHNIRHSDLAKFQYLHIEYIKDGTKNELKICNNIFQYNAASI